MNTQYHISQFERYVKSDPHWKSLYINIDRKIRSSYDYRNFFRNRRNSVQKTLKSFELMLFQSDDVESISTRSGKELFDAFLKYYSQTRCGKIISKYNMPARKDLKKVLKGLER